MTEQRVKINGRRLQLFFLLALLVNVLTTSAQDEMSYGFIPEQPIKVGKGACGGTANEHRYLELLRDERENTIAYKKIGSCCPYPSNNGVNGMAPCDLYKVKYEDKKGKPKEVILYLSCYDYERPRAPHGFTIASNNIDNDLKPLIEAPSKSAADIKELRLCKEGLKEVPSYIFSLPALTYLDLSDNQLSTIPTEIARLTGLTGIVLSGNNIRRLPDEMTSLGMLEEIWLPARMDWDDTFSKLAGLPRLKKIHLNGSEVKLIPPGIIECRGVEMLDLRNTPALMLADAIVTLSRMPSLKTLYLGGNAAVREIPSNIDRIGNLEALHIVGCNIIELPVELGSLPALCVLDLGDNQFLKTLPSSFSGLPSLREVDLSAMGEGFDFADAIMKLEACPGLKKLTLNRNDQLVRLPDAVGHLTSLEALELNDCTHLSSLPEAPGRLTTLISVGLNGTTALKALPKWISSMQSLQEISIGGNTGLDLATELPRLCMINTLRTIVMGGGTPRVPDSIAGCAGHLKTLDIRSARHGQGNKATRDRLHSLLPQTTILGD